MFSPKSKELLFTVVMGVTACGGGGGKNSQQDVAPVSASTGAAAVQDAPQQVVLPTGGEALSAWLKTGAYKAWHCETAPHPQRFPSPHGLNRICSNDLLAKAGPGEYPVGAASVKEIYSPDHPDQLVSYAVEQHLSAGTGADTWQWFAQLKGVIKVDGNGATPAAKATCVGCHSAAGSDAKHSGHDFVYTQIK